MQIQLRFSILPASLFDAASKEQIASILDVSSILEHIEPKHPYHAIQSRGKWLFLVS